MSWIRFEHEKHGGRGRGLSQGSCGRPARRRTRAETRAASPTRSGYQARAPTDATQAFARQAPGSKLLLGRRHADLPRPSGRKGELSLGDTQHFMEGMWSDHGGNYGREMGGLECDEILDFNGDHAGHNPYGSINYQMSPVLSARMSPPKMSPSVVGSTVASHRPPAKAVMAPTEPMGLSPTSMADRLVFGPHSSPPPTTRRGSLSRRYVPTRTKLPSSPLSLMVKGLCPSPPNTPSGFNWQEQRRRRRSLGPMRQL